MSTITAMLVADEMYEAANLLRQSDCHFELTGYDNWNGGTEIFCLFIRLPAATFARLTPRKDALEKQITERLQAAVSSISDDWFSATLMPKIEKQKNWKVAGGRISRSIRQNILDGLRIEKVDWAGSLEETEFLGRVFDLSEMPSTDPRFPDAAGDIWQHRVNNYDWPDEWLFSDGRFDLLGCPDDIFLRFLSEMVHPVVRPNSPWQNLDFSGLCSFRTLALRWPNDGFQERKTANRAGTTPRNAPKGDSWLSSAPLGSK